MNSKLIKLVLLSVFVLLIYSLSAYEAFAQCGLPGTPPCKKKKVTKTKPTTRPKSTGTSTKTVTAPPEIVYRPVQPLISQIWCQSPDIPNTSVKCPADIKPSYLPTEHENGYDIAVVQYDKALLREKPKIPFSGGTKCVWTYDTSKEAPCEGSFLLKGDNLVILDRDPTADWLNVINTETGKEGWVYKGHITIYYTRSPKVSPVAIEEERGESYSDPKIRITNQSELTMTLRLGDSIYTLAPYTERNITLTEGRYKFYSSFPRAYPLLGEKYFSRGYNYSWTFYIK